MVGLSGRRREHDVQELKRTLCLSDRIERDPCVACGRRNVTVTEQVLNHPDVDALLQEMGGEAVPQRVNGDSLVEARGLSSPPTGAL